MPTTTASKKASKGPPKQRRGNREYVIRVRTTSDQRNTMEKAARKEGLDLSTWLRMVGLRAGGYLSDK